MGNLDSRRLTLEELAEIKPIVSRMKQQSCFGCGDGTSADPFTWEEYQSMVSAETWKGGFYIGEDGETNEDAVSTSGGSTSNSGDDNHCVALAISNAPGGTAFSIVKKYVEDLFGANQGVPENSLFSVIKKFFQNAQTISRESLQNGNIEDTLLWYKLPNGDLHMVNGVFNQNDTILIKTGNMPGYLLPTDSIYGIFKTNS